MAAIVGDWTYTGLPGTNDIDAVRFLVGDVDPDDKQVGDGEITWAASQEANTTLAAALVCEHLAGRYSREVNSSSSDLNRAYATKATAYASKAKTLRLRGTGWLAPGVTVTGKPYAGGISIDDTETIDDDSDRPSPRFDTGDFDNTQGY
jgi:hypothetical protein